MQRSFTMHPIHTWTLITYHITIQPIPTVIIIIYSVITIIYRILIAAIFIHLLLLNIHLTIITIYNIIIIQVFIGRRSPFPPSPPARASILAILINTIIIIVNTVILSQITNIVILILLLNFL